MLDSSLFKNTPNLSGEMQVNFDYIASLQYLANKDILITKMDFKYPIHKGLQLIIPELEGRKLYYTIDITGKRLRIELPNGKGYIIYANNYGLNPGTLGKIFKDKNQTTQLMIEGGFRVPDEMILLKNGSKFLNQSNNITSAEEFCLKVGYPVILKPLNGQQGKGIEIIYDASGLVTFYQEYCQGKKFNDIALIQKYIYGNEYRIIYFDGEIISCYQKKGFQLLGDGKKTIFELLSMEEFDTEKLLELTKIEIKKKGLSLDVILSKGEILQVFEFVNDASSNIIPYNFNESDLKLMKSISNYIGSDYFGVDILSKSDSISDGYIIEINGLPGIERASTIDVNLKTKFRRKMIDYILRK